MWNKWSETSNDTADKIFLGNIWRLSQSGADWLDTGRRRSSKRQGYFLENCRADLGGICKKLEVLWQGHRKTRLTCARKLLKKVEIFYKVFMDSMAHYKQYFPEVNHSSLVVF